MKHHAFESCPSYLFNTFSFFQYSIKIITMVLGQKKILGQLQIISSIQKHHLNSMT